MKELPTDADIDWTQPLSTAVDTTEVLSSLEKVRRLSSEKFSQVRQIEERLKKQMNADQLELIQLKEKYLEQRALNQAFSASLEKLTAELNQLRQTQPRLLSRLAQQDSKVDLLNHELTQTTNRCNDLQNNLSKITGALNDANEHYAKVKQENEALRKQLEHQDKIKERELNLERNEKVIQHEREMLDQMISAHREEMEKTNVEVEMRKIELSRQEARLRGYAEVLTQEKQILKNFSQQLAGELAIARRAHPLDGYLSLTENELVRIETQLRRLPESSNDRPKLELCLTQLVQQRQLLQQVITASRNELQDQASLILQIAQNDLLEASLPPPPPQKKTPSASEV